MTVTRPGFEAVGGAFARGELEALVAKDAQPASTTFMKNADVGLAVLLVTPQQFPSSNGL
jgi:hypothetical protein